MNNILDLPFVLETRRNHALEHATLHVLAAKYPAQHMAGHSNPTGFFILGDLSLEDVTNAVTQALTRLRAGESNLAIHAGCGTNIATTLLLSGTFAWFALRGAKSTFGRILRLPFAVAFAVAGFASASRSDLSSNKRSPPMLRWVICKLLKSAQPCRDASLHIA